jgi:hypothetical protein
MMALTQKIDKMLGYVFINPPPSGSSTAGEPVPNPLLQAAEAVIPGQHISDVQERWLDEKEAFDRAEDEQWREEGKALNIRK